MASERYLLDTSAILAFIEDEPGADRVEEMLREAEALLPWTVFMETYYISHQERGEAEADRRYAMLKVTSTTLLQEVTEPVLLTAARLKAQHRIAFADAIIAAYAVQSDAILLHKDPEYEVLAGELRLESLPYKAE